jgi:hypothetical protein
MKYSARIHGLQHAALRVALVVCMAANAFAADGAAPEVGPSQTVQMLRAYAAQLLSISSAYIVTDKYALAEPGSPQVHDLQKRNPGDIPELRSRFWFVMSKTNEGRIEWKSKCSFYEYKKSPDSGTYVLETQPFWEEVSTPSEVRVARYDAELMQIFPALQEGDMTESGLVRARSISRAEGVFRRADRAVFFSAQENPVIWSPYDHVGKAIPILSQRKAWVFPRLNLLLDEHLFDAAMAGASLTRADATSEMVFDLDKAYIGNVGETTTARLTDRNSVPVIQGYSGSLPCEYRYQSFKGKNGKDIELVVERRAYASVMYATTVEIDAAIDPATLDIDTNKLKSVYDHATDMEIDIDK